MNIHKNARLTPRGRERIVRQVENGQAPEAVAEAAGVCPRTVRKWVDRYRREGLAGLQDRSSRPHRCTGRRPRLLLRRSSDCVGSAGQASRSLLRSGSHLPPSVVFCAATRDDGQWFVLPFKDASAFARSSLGHTLRRPMEKLSASFKPRFANGLTLAPIRTRISDRPSCSTGSIATIGIGHMVA
jgi:transposase-like protein